METCCSELSSEWEGEKVNVKNLLRTLHRKRDGGT